MKTPFRRFAMPLVLGFVSAVGGAHCALADVNPQKMFMISSVNFRSPDGKTPKNTINFFDVSDVGPGGPTSGVFGNDPLFSIFLGFDAFQSFNATTGAPTGTEEDASALTFNPVNGTIYTYSFNQRDNPLDPFNATPDYGQARATNDSAGDFDLWRIDYQTILKDFTTNNRDRGTIYAPEFAPTTAEVEAALADASDPRFDGTADGRFFGLDHEESFTLDGSDVWNPDTVRLPNTIEKIGEVGRAGSDRTGGASFFNTQVEFINPETLLRLDATTSNTQAGDHQIRVYKRVSTTPGVATFDQDGADNISGFNLAYGAPGVDDDNIGGLNRGTTESWESTIIGRLEMDGADSSDGPEWAAVKQGATLGVWVVESDGTNNGDDASFFEIDFSTPTPSVVKKDLFRSGSPASQPNFMQMYEDPGVDQTMPDGEVDNLLVDASGRLIVVESGFNDTPTPLESKVYSVGINDYDAADSDGDGVNEILPAGAAGAGFNDTAVWTPGAVLPVTGPLDDDTGPTDTRFVAFDRGTGLLYIVDGDTGNTEDLYVFDTNSGEIVYSELDSPFNTGILNKGTLLVMLRGDVNEDGFVNGTDIDLMFSAIADPTLGGTVTDALGKEWYDLTGDGDLTVADADEMVRGILGTEYGDHNLDGMVDGADLAIWQEGFGAGSEWESGDNDGDGDVDGNDFLRWQRNLGFNNMNLAAAGVPEPGTLGAALAGVAALAAVGGRRRGGTGAAR